jgi:8-oxo-dGTP diphosphatase
VVRIVGVAEGGTKVIDLPLGHGQHPEAAAYAAGYLLRRPIDACRDEHGELVVRWAVHPRTIEPAPDLPRRGIDPGLELDGGQPVPRQRVAAYALVRSRCGLLATEYSDKTAVSGRWGLPGGGIDAHEAPAAAVLRETIEETDQRIVLGKLAAVQSAHWIGRSPSGVVQDFHAIRLVYLADCARPGPPRVLDAEGTTAAARWVAIEQWSRLRWTTGWRTLLAELLAG